MIKNFEGRFIPMQVDLEKKTVKYFCNYKYYMDKQYEFKNQSVVGKYDKQGMNGLIVDCILNAIKMVYEDVNDILKEEKDFKFNSPEIVKINYSEISNTFKIHIKIGNEIDVIKYNLEEGEIESQDIKRYFEYNKEIYTEEEATEKALNILTNYLFGIYDVIFDCGFNIEAEDIYLFTIQKYKKDKLIYFYRANFNINFFQTDEEKNEETEYFSLIKEGLVSETDRGFEKEFVKESEAILEATDKIVRKYKSIDFNIGHYLINCENDKIEKVVFKDIKKDKTKIEKEMIKLKRIIRNLA